MTKSIGKIDPKYSSNPYRDQLIAAIESLICQKHHAHPQITFLKDDEIHLEGCCEYVIGIVNNMSNNEMIEKYIDQYKSCQYFERLFDR